MTSAISGATLSGSMEGDSIMAGIPSELAIGGVYLPPLLIASVIGVALASLTALFLNRCRLSRFFWYPPLVFLALAVIYSGLIGTFVIPG